MSRPVYQEPGEGDPRSFDPDKDLPQGGRAIAAADAPGDERQYRKMKCFRGPNRDFVGYLSTRGSASVAIGIEPEYVPAGCAWFEKDGALYLAKETTPYDRCLGLGDYGYASWALQQARNMGYFTNVIRNPDGTISPGIYPETYLAGPWMKYGIGWGWWAPKGHPDILVCEMEDALVPAAR